MTLAKIRIASPEELKQAMSELLRDCSRMTEGEVHAMTRTIRDRAEKLGIDLSNIVEELAKESRQ